MEAVSILSEPDPLPASPRLLAGDRLEAGKRVEAARALVADAAVRVKQCADVFSMMWCARMKACYTWDMYWGGLTSSSGAGGFELAAGGNAPGSPAASAQDWEADMKQRIAHAEG